jgi:hypothetical protein
LNGGMMPTPFTQMNMSNGHMNGSSVVQQSQQEQYYWNQYQT